MSYDIEMPRPIAWFRAEAHEMPVAVGADWRIAKLNDQHAYLELPAAADLRVGDLVACGISHPCTTFDKWQLLWLVDDRYEVKSAIRTFLHLEHPFNVLLEIGIAGGRTGCRSEAQALALARRIAASRHARLVGLECFEGLTVTGKSEEDVPRVEVLLQTVKATALACDAEHLFAAERIILSAGGSAAFDIVARELPLRLSRPVLTILRSGCYFTHDSGFYERMLGPIRERSGAKWRARPGLKPALEVWGQVQSRPEPGLAILTMGRRDVSYDIEMPRPIAWFRAEAHEMPVAAGADWRIAKLNDQHAYLKLPAAADLGVGDLVACGISHPCTTFDKWQLLWLVDDRYEVKSAIRTFF